MKIFSTTREALFLITHPQLWFRTPLKAEDLPSDPYSLFEQWYRRARAQWFGEFPNAFCLSTVSEKGFPEGRIVLLKEWDREGFVFYTNAQSQKGRALEANPKAAMTFYWERLQRQIRIQGTVEKISDEQASRYFGGRPRRSQLGAWVSKQSTVIADRDELTEGLKEASARFDGREVERPPYWTGFRVRPVAFEFWQLRISRLHDRFEYRSQPGGSWQRVRLAP